MKSWFRNVVTKIRNATYKFMCGRNGVDNLSNFLIGISFVFLIPSLFTSGKVRMVFYVLFWVTVIYAYFRIFSRNVYKRLQENNWFTNKMNYYKMRISQRRQYKFYDCPKCHTHLRVPRGAGNITITCKKCGYEFDKKA